MTIYKAHANSTDRKRLRRDAAWESYRRTKLATQQRKQGRLHFNETSAWASTPCQRLLGWNQGSSSAVTPLLPGIVLQPLRFYEAKVTARANSKRPESGSEGRQAGSRSLELHCGFASTSSSSSSSSADQPRRRAQHCFPACTVPLSDIQRFWRGRGGTLEAERAEMQMLKRSVSQVSISLQAPFLRDPKQPHTAQPTRHPPPLHLLLLLSLSQTVQTRILVFRSPKIDQNYLVSSSVASTCSTDPPPPNAEKSELSGHQRSPSTPPGGGGRRNLGADERRGGGERKRGGKTGRDPATAQGFSRQRGRNDS